MPIRFSETTLDEAPRHLRLIDSSGKLLLELKGHEIDEAIRSGFLDPSNYHFSMYQVRPHPNGNRLVSGESRHEEHQKTPATVR